MKDISQKDYLDLLSEVQRLKLELEETTKALEKTINKLHKEITNS